MKKLKDISLRKRIFEFIMLFIPVIGFFYGILFSDNVEIFGIDEEEFFGGMWFHTVLGIYQGISIMLVWCFVFGVI